MGQESGKQVCSCCRGFKYRRVELKNLGTLDYEEHIISCDMCNGKGYITQEDRYSYYHSLVESPCPYCDESVYLKGPLQVQGVIAKTDRKGGS